MAKEQLAVIENQYDSGKDRRNQQGGFCTSENKVSGTGKWNAYA